MAFIPSKFDIKVTYLYPDTGQYISDMFNIDLTDYHMSTARESDIYEQGKNIVKAIDKLTKQVTRLNNRLSEIESIAGATGIDLSVTTLRNLMHIISRDNQIEKINPGKCNLEVFSEVLGVDDEVAYKLELLFCEGIDKEKNLSDIKGMTPELIELFKKHFKFHCTK